MKKQLKLREKVSTFYKSEYSSSPIDISDEEIEIMIKSDCECRDCHRSIFDMNDFPVVREEHVYCEDCEMEQFYSTCPICEEHYENYTDIQDERMFISKETALRYSIKQKPGFYKILKHPIYYGDCISGFDELFDDAIELERECDINSMLYKLHPYNGREKVYMDFCCDSCFEKYTGKTKIINNYYDKKYGRKRVKFEKEVIALGK